jgi:hypothetical protein
MLCTLGTSLNESVKVFNKLRKDKNVREAVNYIWENGFKIKGSIPSFTSMVALGAGVKAIGKDLIDKDFFKKVDYEYPIKFARTGFDNSIYYYGLITSMGADP